MRGFLRGTQLASRVVSGGEDADATVIQPRLIRRLRAGIFVPSGDITTDFANCAKCCDRADQAAGAV